MLIKTKKGWAMNILASINSVSRLTTNFSAMRWIQREKIVTRHTSKISLQAKIYLYVYFPSKTLCPLTTPLSTQDVIPHVVSFEWASDNKTLFYTVPDQLLRPHRVSYTFIVICLLKYSLALSAYFRYPNKRGRVDIRRTR